MKALRFTPVFALLAVACHTAGNSWMSQPLPGESDDDFGPPPTTANPPSEAAPPQQAASHQTRVIGDGPPPIKRTKPTAAQLRGKVLGKFRNTYYDFPSELDHKGAPVALMGADCEAIAQVPQGFHDAVCVQGSGTLRTGSTVSFNRRNCECARVCPRTDQRICFDELDRTRFPWGRGATGKAITPLLTIAVDSKVVPLGTPVYIPEYDGMPRNHEHSSMHDGCFIAQDRGVRIKGKHVDIFTGHESMTRLWNQLVPSNEGVTVVLESPRCQRATVSKPGSSRR